MKELTHVMIDLETVDVTASAAILSIGAVKFDPRINKINLTDTFYMEFDYKKQVRQGRTKDSDTMAWWAKQTHKVRSVFNGVELLPEGLEELAFWLPPDAKVWGNGPVFDIGILENAYNQYQIDIPWKFWNVRDYRTLREMYENNRGGFMAIVSDNNHNALDDAIKQARTACKMWKRILK